jgi:tight adherence protein B
MSAWLLCGLPIFVAIVVTVIAPEYMSILWLDQRGHYLIAAALSLQVTGMLIIRKILNIKI